MSSLNKKLIVVPTQNPKKQAKTHNKVHSPSLLSPELAEKLQEMRSNSELCDITLCAEMSPYHTEAHRMVLALKSPYFNKFFSMDKEIKEFKFSKAFDPECVENMMCFFYNMDLVITAENVEKYLQLCVLLELQDVKEACCRFIATILDLSNFAHYLALSSELQTDWLTDKIYLFLEWNFYSLISSKDLVKMKSTQFHRLVCGAKGIRVEREETLYTAVMKWYIHKPASRKSTLQSILQHISFIRMSPNFLAAIQPDLVDGLGLCKEKIKSAQSLQAVSSDEAAEWAIGRRNRIPDIIYLFSSSSNRVDRFDEVQNTFVTCPQLRVPPKHDGEGRCAVRVGNGLFLLSVKSVLRWNHYKLKWEVYGEGTTIKDAGICAGNESIIVVGGKESTSVKKFDVKDKTWSSLTPMSTGRRGPGVVCHSEILYVLGGFNLESGQPLSKVESLSIATGQWSTLPPMQVPRCRLCCVTLYDKIYAMGGRDNVTSYVTVETFDLKSSQWDAPKEHMNYAREDFCATVHNGKIVCLGGRRLHSVEWCDPNSDGKWIVIGSTGDSDKVKTGLSCVTFSPPFEDSSTVITEF